MAAWMEVGAREPARGPQRCPTPACPCFWILCVPGNCFLLLRGTVGLLNLSCVSCKTACARSTTQSFGQGLLATFPPTSEGRVSLTRKPSPRVPVTRES